jgi:hypothetical protein
MKEGNMIELEAHIRKESSNGGRYVARLETNMLYNLTIEAHAYDTPRFAAARLARGLQAMGFQGRIDVYYTNNVWRWTLGEPQADLYTYLDMEIDSEATINV